MSIKKSEYLIDNLFIAWFFEQVDAGRYAMLLNHSIIGPRHFISFFECRYKNGTNSLYLNLNSKQKSTIRLHFNNWRDILIVFTGINEDRCKEYGINIKWDASKNPSSKFIMNVELLNDNFRSSFKSTSTINISYPGRHMIAFLYLVSDGWKMNAIDASFQWDLNRRISITANTYYNSLTKNLKLESQLSTPFKNWNETSICGE